MARNVNNATPNTDFVYGPDAIVGKYVQISDRRFAGHPLDGTGEGYILDWDEMLGFTTNLIGATEEEVKSANGSVEPKLLPKVEAFIQSLMIS